MRKTLLTGCLLLAAAVANAQFGREAVWPTSGNNAQRSSWIRSDGKISRDTITSDFQLLWKLPLEAHGTSSMTQPIIMDRYIGYRGFRSFAFVESASNGLFAVDTDLNRIEWQKHMSASNRQTSSSNCAGIASASVSLPAGLAFPSGGVAGIGLGGRGDPAKSAVGEPYQGAVTLAAVSATASPTAPRPAAVVRPSGPPRTRPPIVLYSLTSDGMFHTLYVSNGEDLTAPQQFVSPGSSFRGLIIVDQVAYVVSGRGCGGGGNEVLALDLATKQITKWSADDATIAGSEGPAFGPDGTIYVATAKGASQLASSVVALDAKTLKPKDWYTAAGQDFTSTPVIFQYRNKIFAAATTKDGSLHILNTAALGGPDHQTPLAKTSGSTGVEGFAPGALALWQDSELTHWLLSPSGVSAITAWKVVDDEHGNPTIQRGWVSKNIAFPSSPVVINGVVFTASNGGAKKARAQRTSSVLYGLDAATGKELWNSKATIGSSVSSLSAGAGQVYVTTDEGALYAFGFPMEH